LPPRSRPEPSVLSLIDRREARQLEHRFGSETNPLRT